MKKMTGFAVSAAISAFLLAGGFCSSALAADPAPTVKVLLENDKVKVYETTYKPGDLNTAVDTATARVVRTLKGGKIERVYPDGKTEPVVLKAGAVRFIAPSTAYNVKNIGKTVVQTYVVQLK